MSINPHALANSFRNFVGKRSLASEPSAVTAEPNGAGFFVYDNDGGVLHVVVTQYKEPIR